MDTSTNSAKLEAATSTGTSSAAAAAAAISKDAPPAACDPVVLAAVATCDWRDRTLWAARQLLGGQSVNGFLRATATVQRIKRQRARQTNSTKAKQEQRQQSSSSVAGTTGANHNDNIDSKNFPMNSEASTKPSAVTEEDRLSTDPGENKKRDRSQMSSASSSAVSAEKAAQQQQEEEEVKARIMNARTAKKFKSEMEIGLRFCEAMHSVVRGSLQELLTQGKDDGSPVLPPNFPLPAPLRPVSLSNTKNSKNNSLPRHLVLGQPPTSATAAALMKAAQNGALGRNPLVSPALATVPANSPMIPGGPHNANLLASFKPPLLAPPTGRAGTLPPHLPPAPMLMKPGDPSMDAFQPPGAPTQGQPQPRQGSLSSSLGATSSTASANNAKTSTLRKLRKKKLPPSGETISIPETDPMGKRYTKKEYTQKVLEVLQYRALKQGDAVAAKVSSRDLWILARVLRDHPGASNLPPAELLKLHPTKRAQLFRDAVMVMDVEDNGNASASPTSVPRHAVLPLPRSYSEASEWCQLFYRKGSRVFAMYPDTTSLYSATVLDSTTWAQENDDIVVVQFDEDEPDETGAIQKCHIPSRFVTPMPVSIMTAAPSKHQGKGGATGSRPGRGGAQSSSQEDDFNFFVNNPSNFSGTGDLNDFADLDFDLGFG